VGEWASLERELEAWRSQSRVVGLWWRDDDAGAVTDSLERLLAMSASHRVPLALATIPQAITPELSGALASADTVSVLQHGFAHRNYAPDGEKKAEYGPHRSPEEMAAELSNGRARFEESSIPCCRSDILVPPWNRITPHLDAHLARAGYRGLSTFGPRSGPRTAAGLRVNNCHLDLLDWRGTRGFVGTGAAVERLAMHLEGRRTGRFDVNEATGVMSHHQAHDADCWGFLEELFSRTGEHAAVCWLSVEELFPATTA